MSLVFSAFAAILVSTAAQAAPSDGKPVQPYLDKLRSRYDIQDAPQPLPDTHETKAAREAEETDPYLERLRRKNNVELQAPVHSRPVSKDAKEVQPYLEALKDGKELEAKKRTKIESAAGFSIVASNRFNIRSDKVQANTFESVYEPDNKYSPSAEVFYERQILRDRTFGSLGPVVRATVIATKGKGVFTRTGAQATDTEFRFFAVPLSLGLSYRFLLPRYIVPFVQGGVMVVPYLETRNDEKPSRKGASRGLSATAGVAFNLDWFANRDAWERYDASGVLHTYLVVQAHYIRTISGPVTFNYDGYYAGLSFEF